MSAASIERSLWHPVVSVAELDAAAGRPLTQRLLGEDLVLWRDGEGGLQAFPDRCPHRGARLSLGRVIEIGGETRLACAYHGWQFAAAGRCARIPAAPSLVPTASHAATAYETRRAHGLWWLRFAPGDNPLPEPRGVPPRVVVCGPFDVESSAPRAIENFLDTAHFGFVHEGWLGDLGHTEVPTYKVELEADGRPHVPHYMAWQPRASSTSTEGAWVDYRYEVLSPYGALLLKQPSEASGTAGPPLQEGYALWCCPVEEERCRVWFSMYTNDEKVADEDLVRFESTIFGQDKPVLESQRPKRLPISGGEAHGPADRLATAYRRYLRERGIAFGVC